MSINESSSRVSQLPVYNLNLIEEKLGEDVDERTNTTSYYIIKTEILNDLKGFLDLCKNPKLSMRMNDNKRFLNYLKNLSKIKKIKTSQKRLSSTMIINSLKIKY